MSRTTLRRPVCGLSAGLAATSPPPILVEPPGLTLLLMSVSIADLLVTTSSSAVRTVAWVANVTMPTLSLGGERFAQSSRKVVTAECSAPILVLEDPGSVVAMLPDLSNTITTSTGGLAL